MVLMWILISWSCADRQSRHANLDIEFSEIDIPGQKNEQIDTKLYAGIFYVSQSGDDQNGNGSKGRPWKSIGYALKNCEGVNKTNRMAVFVARGVYNEDIIHMSSGVDLYGGFNPAIWERNVHEFPAEIRPAGKHRIMVAADDARLDGFVISGGVIRGNGAGIFCDGVSPEISNNVFRNNKTLKPDAWDPEYWHETANDGGAVYCVNGAAPVIRNNLFIENETENGRGAAVAANNRCKPIISQNVFLHNIAGLDDPMRSSDGGAVAIFDWCDAKIEGNIFLGNQALASNDGGAIFIALWSSAHVFNNILVDNESADDAGALFVGGQEHRYDAPPDVIPEKDKFFVTIANNRLFGNRNGSMNSGAMRFTMESRGEFKDNVTAFNNGIYFQRSEVAVKHNIILDNFLFIETKEGLEPGAIEDNYIWGDFKLTVPATVKDNIIRDEHDEGLGRRQHYLAFIDNGIRTDVLSCNFNGRWLCTDILSKRVFKSNQLVNRIVRARNKWGVVRSNHENHIAVWGNLTGASELRILPTYDLIQNQ